MTKYIPQSTTATFPLNPDSIFFNFFVYGNGNSILIAGLRENDGNGSIAYEPMLDDEFQYEIPLNFSGWKLISIRYSDMLVSTNPDFGGSGNHLHEPQTITEFVVALLPTIAGGSGELIYDYPVLTFGGPLTGY